MNDATNTLIEIMAWLSQNALNLLIQSTVLILLGLLASRILRRHGSAVQSAIYRATLVTVLICPIAAMALNQFGFDGWTIQLPETTRTVMVAEPDPSVSIAPPKQPVRLPDTTNLTPPASELPVSNMDNGLEESKPSQSIVLLPSRSSGSADAALPVPPDLIMIERTISNTAWVALYSALGFLWLLGTFLLLARLVLAYRKIALVRRHSPSASDSDQSLCGKLASRINVRAPDVRRNSLLASPCLTGITSPTILLPSEIKEPVPLEKAFAHELAHLRRHDTLWNLVQRIALALFFYQPLMWRLVYRLEQTAEEVCDDYVVRHCLDRSGYAQQLVDLAESNLLAPNMAGLGMFKNSSSMLGHRIVRILDTTRKLTTQISLPMVVGIVALTMVCATLGGFLGNGKSPLSMFNSTDETTEQEDTGPLIKLSGRILDSYGSPVSNAKVSVFPGVSAAFGNKNPPAYTTTASQNDGSFEVSFPRSSLILSKNGYEWAKNFCLVAMADGYGVNWMDADQLQDPAIENSEDENRIYAPVDLRLVTDKTKTWLQLIDPEGNPVSNATARITHLTRFADEDISAFYEAQTRGEAFPARSISDDLIIHGLPDYSANEKGEIEIAGLGDNRLASLEITGPGIAIRQVRVATADAETVSVKYGGMQQLTITTYGAKSTITCEPTQPIFGRVTDRETGRPLAGVKIMSSKFAGANLGGIRILQTESDDKGRFRLTGMPKGPGNTIIAVPGNDHPYFMMRFEVPAVSGLEPVELDLPLQRGVFIRGEVNDLKTGKPIAGATFSYLPFLSNEVAAGSPVYEAGQFMEYQNRYMSGLDGSFQLVGLPGRGVVGLNVRFYPAGMGWEDIDEDEKEDNGQVRTFNRPITPSRSWPTAMKQVDISGTQTEHRIQFQLDPGLSIPLQITDPDDQPLVGVVASRLRSPHDYQYVTTKSVVDAAAFGPDEKRMMRFHHKEKAISLVVELDASVLDPAGELEKPIQIKLMPDSTITGKLVDGNGDAISHGKIRCDVGGGRNFSMMLPTVITDKEGRFQIHHVPSGTHYSISVSLPGDFKGVCRRLEVAAGEHIDLGTINVSSEERPEPTRNQLTAIDDENVRLSGTVVDREGNPVAGARVFRKTFETRSADDGSFHLEVPRAEAKSPTGLRYLMAEVDGYGRGFCNINTKESTQHLVTLPENNFPISGTLVDPQGKPIVGATVQATSVSVPESIDDYLTAAARDQATLQDLPAGAFYSGYKKTLVQSDKDGKFTISGTGDHRVVRLKIQSDNIALSKTIVVTANTEPLSVFREAGMLGNRYGKVAILGHRPTIVCEPTQVINGVVIDRESGAPLAGIDVYSDRFSDVPIGGVRDLKATTDSEGRFRLLGMPVGDKNTITAFPPTSGTATIPYLARDVLVPTGENLKPVEMRIELQRGAWVRGKVVDRKTGKPVSNARVTYKPYQDNQLADELYSDNYIPHPIGYLETKDDGVFQIAALPGKALLDTWVVGDPYYPPGQGYDEIPADRKDHLGNIQVLGYTANQQHPTAMKEINVVGHDPVENLTFELDPGKSIFVKMVDANGNPVSNVHVSNASTNINHEIVSKGSEFEATGFLKGQKRTLTFHDKDQNLGRIMTIGFDDVSPVKVTLRPNSVVTGKLVDGNGDPLPRARVRFDLLENRNYFLKSLPFQYQTNEEGVFEQIAIPGKYKVQVGTLDGFYFLYPALEIPPGERIDLGTLDVEAVHAKTMARLNTKVRQQKSEWQDEANDPGVVSHQDMTITGVVRDPDGTPVENAEIGVYLYWRIEGGYKTVDETIGKTRSDRNGNYEFTISEQVFENLESKVSRPTGGYTAHKDAIARGFVISANAPSHAPVWHRFENKKPSEALDFQLAKSNVVIDGKVVDLEGKPMSGVTVRPVMLGVLGSLFDWEIGNPVTSDTHGRFELQNIGDDRTVTLELSGARIARTWVHSQTKQREPWFVDPDNAFYGVTHGFGSQPVIPVERGQSLIGRITDGQTGKPLEGVTVTTGNRERKQIVQTDADGKYRIDGLVPRNAKSPPLYFTVKSPNPEYFITTIWNRDNLADDDRYTPLERDVVLHSGKIISGQLIDAKTGKGVPGTVMYYPKLDNAAAADFANFDPEIRTLRQQNRAIANDNGEFSITVVPGQGLLAARAVRNKQYETALGSANINNEADLLEYYHLPEVIRFSAFHKLNVTKDSADVVQIKLQPLTHITDSGEIVVEKNNGPMAPQDDSVSFAGIVVDLNGRAVGDAKVTHGEIKTTTGVDGSFTIKLPAEMVAKFSSGKPYISIEKDGFGRSLAQLAADDKNQQLTIVNDDHPIEGKLIDTEGNPIVGATVTVQQLSLFGKGMLDSHLSKALAQGGSLTGLPQGMGMAGLKIAPVTTDNDGRFTIRGIGSGRFAHLTISGETTAFRKAVVATSDLGNVQYEEPRANFLGDGIIHSRHPVLTCEPSQPIDGIVIDRDTKKPLAGFNVTSYGFLNDGPEHLVGQTDLKTTTDDQGRFRLTGMPKGKGNQIIVTAPVRGEFAQPYISQIGDVPDARGLDPIQMEVGLQRGVWISGKVVDLESGKPVVRAGIQYMPFDDNEAANQIDRFRQQLVDDYYGHRTDEQGNFRFVAVPGPAVLGPWAMMDSTYPIGQGMEDIPDERKSENGTLRNQFFRGIHPQTTAVKTVDVPLDGINDLTFELSRGKAIRIKTVDSQGEAIDGVNVAYIPALVGNNFKTGSSEFEATGFLPGKPRTVVFRHNEKRIGAIISISADEAASPVVVTLQPFATVTAKLQEADGSPSSGTALSFDLLDKSGSLIHGLTPSQTGETRSNKQGNFSASLIPGKYAYSFRSLAGFSGHKKIELTAGQTLDLGTIDVTKKLSVARPMMQQQPRVSSNKKNGDEDQAAAADRVIQGVVSDTDDRPIANATVQFNSWKSYPDFEFATLAETVSDAAGKFSLTIEDEKYKAAIPPENSKVRAGVIVRAKGYASLETRWSKISADQPLQLLLSAEHKISGRVVDLEGRQVVGAKVHVTYALPLGKDLMDPWLQEVRTKGDSSEARKPFLRRQLPSLNGYTGAINPFVETNERGEFEIEDIPSDSIVQFRVEHPLITTQQAVAVTRSMETAGLDMRYKVFGDHPIVVTQPCRPIVGTVLDSETNQPIAGATVFCTQMGLPDTVYWSSPAPKTKTDKQGNFELVGVPKSDRTELMVYPPLDQPYLIKQIRRVPDTVGLEPAEMAIQLHRGIWITGKLVDNQTDGGIKGEIVYLPMKDNPHLKAITGFQVSNRLDPYNFLGHFNTDDNGNYRIAGLPGRAVLGARVPSQKYRTAAGYEKLLQEFGTNYSEARIEQARKFGTDLRGRKFVDTFFEFHVWKWATGSSYVGIEPQDGVDSFEQNIPLDAGNDMTVKVVDADDNLVDRFEITRFDGFYGKKDFTHGIGVLQRMGSDETRTVFVRALDRPLGAIVSVAAADDSPNNPQTIVLQPYGTVRGRLVDQAGKPLVNYSVDTSNADQATTNTNGEFEIANMFADQKFKLEISAPGEDEYRLYLDDQMTKAGKTIELGEINVEKLEGIFVSGMAG